ncbi:MAG: hypothetical protein Q4D14_00715 [Bacteroidales bacterium]|nr:hypothetical protein [Bacteroidales bacterium]
MKKNALPFLISCMLVTLLSACKQEINPDALIEAENKMVVYTNLQINNIDWGDPLDILEPGDEKFELFAQWLKDNNKGWKNDFQTYDFPSIMLAGTHMNFCVYDKFVVLMYDDYYLTKKTDTDKLQFLVEGVKNNFTNDEPETTIMISTTKEQ